MCSSDVLRGMLFAVDSLDPERSPRMKRAIRRLVPRPRLRFKLGLKAGAAMAIVIAGGAYLTVGYFKSKLFQLEREVTEQDSEELRGVLEEEMIAADRKVVNRLVSDIGRAPGVAWVSVLDAHGTVQISSDPSLLGRRFGEGSPERENLEAWQEARETRSHAVSQPRHSVIRVMTPLANRAACHRCHGGAHAINGMLIIDRSLKPLHAAMASGTKYLAIGGVVGLLMLLGSLGLAIERIVLRRLERLRTAARCLGSGDLAARADDEDEDELGDLAREFNGMADRLQSAMGGLAAQRRQLDELVNGIADGVVLLDLQGRIVTINRACASRIRGEALAAGAGYHDLLRATGIEIPAGTQLPAERALTSGKLEKEVVPVAGSERFEELYAQPLRAPDGRIMAVIEVWRDITDRKALEAGLSQSERLAALGVLASSVAHEVGNPLASIITAVDGLLARLPADSSTSADEMRDYLELVRKQVFRCRAVTERLLGFARIPSGRDSVIDVSAAAREVLVLVGPQARAQGVEFELRAPSQGLAIAPDMLVEQVFLNLVLNALKAMPSGGKLRVDVTAEESAIVVAFADTGYGISEEMLRHLFKPFRRARQDGGGTGLGLFISYSLVERSGGQIEVESPPGGGATFKVRLRRAVAEPALRAHVGVAT